MSAEVLRAAARLMRERAEAATDAPWFADGFTIRGGAQGLAVGSAHNAEHVNARHIASWHPAVALAVADWLDAAYADWHYSEHSLGAMSARAMSGQSNLPDGMALAVARAYLGESA